MTAIEKIISLPLAERARFLSGLSVAEAQALAYDWRFWARDAQLTPPEFASGEKFGWYLQAGRGYGKTRTAVEQVYAWIKEGFRRIALVAMTPNDYRKTMIEGESGFLNIGDPARRPIWNPSIPQLTFPSSKFLSYQGKAGHHDNAIATPYSAEEPRKLRGPNHDKAWADEPAYWKYPMDTWDNLMFTLRLPPMPQVVVTGTPRPTKLIKQIIADPTFVVTRGTTHENKAHLAPAYYGKIIAKYMGTRLGRQELDGEVLKDNPGALWSQTRIDELRVVEAPDLKRIVVAIDPAVTSTDTSDETGIIVGGIGLDNHGYVLGDLSKQTSPDHWARIAVMAYRTYKADRIVAEVNNGGDLVEVVIRTVDPNVSYDKVHASKGKITRAEPVAALYEQGRIHHVGNFPELEDQLCDYDPNVSTKSPDRLDALVWCFTNLMLEMGAGWGLFEHYRDQAAANQPPPVATEFNHVGVARGLEQKIRQIGGVPQGG